MRKILFVAVGVLTALFIVNGFNAAYAKGCPPGQEKKGWKCVDIEDAVTATGGNVANNYNPTNNNLNTIGNATSVFGDAKTLSPEANAIIEKGAIENTNKNYNTNLNTNVNENKNVQDQIQVQSQMSVNDNSNKGNKQSNDQKTEVTFTDNSVYEDKRDLINPTTSPSADAKLSEGKAYTGKTKGSIWSDLMDMSVPMTAAKGLAKAGGDVEITLALMGENDFQTSHVIVSENPSGVLMGIVYASPDGDDCFAAGMEGKSLIAAMKAGATGIKRISQTDGQETNGSAWNVGLGGGASMFAKGDDIAIAPSGGLGYGSASASNEKRPEMAFKIYFDESLVKGTKVPAQTGNHN